MSEVVKYPSNQDYTATPNVQQKHEKLNEDQRYMLSLSIKAIISALLFTTILVLFKTGYVNNLLKSFDVSETVQETHKSIIYEGDKNISSSVSDYNFSKFKNKITLYKDSFYELSVDGLLNQGKLKKLFRARLTSKIDNNIECRSRINSNYKTIQLSGNKGSSFFIRRSKLLDLTEDSKLILDIYSGDKYIKTLFIPSMERSLGVLI